MKDNKEAMIIYPCYFSKDIYKKVGELAKEENRSRAAIVRIALIHYLKARKRI